MVYRTRLQLLASKGLGSSPQAAARILKRKGKCYSAFRTLNCPCYISPYLRNKEPGLKIAARSPHVDSSWCCVVLVAHAPSVPGTREPAPCITTHVQTEHRWLTTPWPLLNPSGTSPNSASLAEAGPWCAKIAVRRSRKRTAGGGRLLADAH
jgi:hypothetical protein